ncbi:hypothetical protein L1N85_24600 [Paenibacillus alkaliterrae]|uniref:hypothetical protein n=1 Tax=Paenibacillus alkaliterrae TaxID=320909 RepID=UPI001F477795|nr:hypothetical protein [Paenibacillus alkaliterrae]MCF2941522.1 hypothetical protein [Paenibacillus alkaliterrae]
MAVQLALFDVPGMKDKETISVDVFYNEFQSLGTHQRNHAGYGGDLRAEREIRELINQGNRCHKEWKEKGISDDTCRDELYEVIVRLWCVKVNGLISRDIYGSPVTPKTYTPAFDDHLAKRIPPEVMKVIPENVLLVNYEEHKEIEHISHFVLYYRTDTKEWYSVIDLYDLRKGKWMGARFTKLYGDQFRADRENQLWTRAGYEQAKADNRLDPQIAAVWTNYIKFFGRGEALCRLGLPPVSAGLTERDFEEVDKYAWYRTDFSSDAGRFSR